MRVLDSMSRGDLEYAVEMLVGLVWELHRPCASEDGATLTDVLSQVGGETGTALKALVAEIWRVEDYAPEEWAELKLKLGI